MDVDQRRQLYEDIYRSRKEKEEKGEYTLEDVLILRIEAQKSHI